MVKSAEPSATSRCVRNPASRSRSSRSTPIKPPSTAASASRSRDSSQFSVGRWLDASCSNGFLLCSGQLLDADSGELEQLVEPGAAERRSLGRGLDFDKGTLTCHDHVHVHLSVGVL